MLWCPKCKVHYRDSYSKCSDCGEELIKEVKDEQSFSKPNKEDEEFVLLMDVGQREGEVIKSLLEAYGIEVRIKFNEAGAYLDVYMGGTVFGIKLLVRESQLEEANNILNSEIEEEEG